MSKPLNMVGMRVGRWTVVGRAENSPTGKAMWRCACDCGATKVLGGTLIRTGRSQSCGCLKSEVVVARNTKHGHSPASGFTPTYHSWVGMVQRCTNPNHKAWADYGGRGITVCERWMVFANFLADMGEKPPRTSIDREKNDLGYAPGNCRWATGTEQARNKRNNAFITANGVTRTRAEWAELIGISASTLADRIKHGCTEVEAVTMQRRSCRGPDRRPR